MATASPGSSAQGHAAALWRPVRLIVMGLAAVGVFVLTRAWFVQLVAPAQGIALSVAYLVGLLVVGAGASLATNRALLEGLVPAGVLVVGTMAMLDWWPIRLPAKEEGGEGVAILGSMVLAVVAATVAACLVVIAARGYWRLLGRRRCQ